MFLTEKIKENGQDVESWGLEKKLILLEAPTGCGKTFFAQQYLPQICLKHNNKMALLVNRKILKEQVEKINYEFMLENSLLESPTKIFTYQSIEGDGKNLKKILEYLESCEYIVLDEVHYFASDVSFNPAAEKSFQRLISLLGKTCLIFMTATPDNFKIILKQCLEIININQKERWEARMKQLDERRENFIYGGKDLCKLSLNKIVSMEEEYKFSDEYRSGEFEIEPPPEPFLYEEMWENNPDYGYVNLNFYNSNESLLDIIIQSKRSEKWLVFVNTKKEGCKLEKKLQKIFRQEGGKNRTVCFVSAEYEKYEKMRNVVDEIVQKKSYSYSVLITTSVLDNGVTISDHRVKNIVVSAFIESEFKQMLGRRRVKEGDIIDLYVYHGTLSWLRKYQRRCFSKFIEAFPVITQGSTEIDSLILEHRISWDVVEGFTYKCNAKRKFCLLSYYMLSQEYVQLKYMAHLMEIDSNAYVKLVCEWLGKDFESATQIYNHQTKEEVYSQIADQLVSLPDFMNDKLYEDFVKNISDQIGIANESTPKTINKILQGDLRTEQYSFESISLAKATFYRLKRGSDFPYRLCPEIKNTEKLAEILNDGKYSAPELFEKLFKKNMPDIFNEKQQVTFLTFCIQHTAGFEKVVFRRQRTSVKLYRK